MAIYDYDGTNNHEIGKVYDYDGSANHQIGKVYDYDGSSNHLIYSAESGIYTVSTTAYSDAVWATSSSVKNTEGYSTMIIDSASTEKGNYGTNIAELWCNGSKVLSAQADGWYNPNISSWAGKSFNISSNGTVYVRAYSDRDSNRDDYQDPWTVTVKFHFV